MNKWQLVEYLLESKKAVDTIMFIDDNIDYISNLDLRCIIEEKLQRFYINLRIIYDKCLSKKAKEILKESDSIYEDTLYHRDKMYAHKDDDYIKKVYENRKELISNLKEKLLHCYEICKDKLPEIITFDFVSYDRNLYRHKLNITPQKEELLKRILYNNQNDENINDKSKQYKVFYDVEDINQIKNPNEYAVILDNGINFYEGLQNRQDACVKINLLHNENMWFRISGNINELEKEWEHLIEEILEKI